MEASKFCKDRNGVLASVKDENKQNFLYSQLPSGKLYFSNMGNQVCMQYKNDLNNRHCFLFYII